MPAGALKGKIEFEKVWFAYNNDNYVLKDVSFTVNPGKLLRSLVIPEAVKQRSSVY